MKIYFYVCNKYRKSKKTKIYLKKKQVFLLFTVNVVMNIRKYLKTKNELKY